MRTEKIGFVIWVVLAIAASADAQGARGRGGSTIEFMAGQPEAGVVVRGAPYSGEATTTVTQTLADGTRIERTTTARMFRDGEGRIRREQTVQGISALNAIGETTVITIVDIVAGVSYVLDPATRTARRLEMSAANMRGRLADTMGVTQPAGRATMAPLASGAPPPAPIAPYSGVVDPLAPAPPPPPPPAPGARGRGANPQSAANMPQPLGTRQLEGLDVVGTKRVEVLPVGRIGNDRPIEIVDERWESPALKMLLQSRHSDPRTGVVEYRVMNIVRAEPAHDLFVVPADYRIIEARNER